MGPDELLSEFESALAVHSPRDRGFLTSPTVRQCTGLVPLETLETKPPPLGVIDYVPTQLPFEVPSRLTWGPLAGLVN